jgi:hypothetical protein
VLTASVIKKMIAVLMEASSASETSVSMRLHGVTFQVAVIFDLHKVCYECYDSKSVFFKISLSVLTRWQAN